jgi:hypothetical protein
MMRRSRKSVIMPAVALAVALAVAVTASVSGVSPLIFGGGPGEASSASPNASPVSASQPETFTATLSIDASAAGVGAVMPARSVKFTEGETVFDVLARECQNNGVHMEYTTSPVYKSVYIEGIDNLYEFDRGELSGWMYSVNGSFPSYGCSRYALKDGDVIAWRYTCDLGKDIGGSGAVQNDG